ncbi:MAG: DNA alkylation response protein, partial [Alphaproteobacteria bacterium]|nr:DNA alkylation response protein [Alphaproteobacteria bacterium]
GNGYIEDWPNARLVRDAHLGVIWDGTSSVNALDVIQRAVRKERSHVPLGEVLAQQLADARGLPGQFRTRLQTTSEQAVAFAEEVGDDPSKERFTRIAASGLYHATTAVAMAYEGAQIAARGGDARRMLMARFVLEHRLSDHHKLSANGGDWEEPAISALLDENPIPVDQAAALLVE